MKQGQKKLIDKSGKSEYDKEIDERSHERETEILELFKMYSQITDVQKAELCILLNKLSGGKLSKKNNMEIKITQENISLEDYLNENLVGDD